MLSFDIRTLESRAAQVNDDLGASDPVWREGDPRPDGAVHVEGRLSDAGDGRFYFSGRIAGSVALECRRCLEEVKSQVDDEAHFIFRDARDEAADDPDVFPYDSGARELDVRPAIRESWLLAVPAFVQCRPDCAGLCSSCGKDLNTGACGCAPATSDSRWEALRKLHSDAR